MSSLKRVLSSRANGSRSRGPVTPAGKQASSLNAIRHGLLAKCVVLTNECRENFEILMAQHIDRYRPADDVELSVVEEMAVAFWRMRRAKAIETRLFDDAIHTREPGDEVGRITGAFTDLALSPQLALLHRYEARLHHIRQRAFKNIHILRNTPPSPNEPTLDPPSPDSAVAPTPAPPAKLEPRDLPNEPTFGPASLAPGKPVPAPPAKLAHQDLPNGPTFGPASPVPGKPTPAIPAKLAPRNMPNEPTFGPASPAKLAPRHLPNEPTFAPAEPPLLSGRLYLLITHGETPPPDEPQPAVSPNPAPDAPAQSLLPSPGTPEQRQSGMPARRPCAERSRPAIATFRLDHRRQNLHPRQIHSRPPGPVRSRSDKLGGMSRSNSYPAALKYNGLFAKRRGGGRMCN